MLIDLLVQRAGHIASREQRTIRRLERHLTVCKHSGIGDVDFVSNVGLGIVGVRKHIAPLSATVPTVFRIREVQVRIPDFDMVSHSRSGLEIHRGR